MKGNRSVLLAIAAGVAVILIVFLMTDRREIIVPVPVPTTPGSSEAVAPAAAAADVPPGATVPTTAPVIPEGLPLKGDPPVGQNAPEGPLSPLPEAPPEIPAPGRS